MRESLSRPGTADDSHYTPPRSPQELWGQFLRNLASAAEDWIDLSQFNIHSRESSIPNITPYQSPAGDYQDLVSIVHRASQLVSLFISSRPNVPALMGLDCGSPSAYMRTLAFGLMTQAAIRDLQREATSETPVEISVFEFGSGVGINGLVALLSDPRATYTAYERDAYSLECAELIFRAFNVQDRVTLHQANFLTEPLPDARFNVIISENFDSQLFTIEPQLDAAVRSRSIAAENARYVPLGFDLYLEEVSSAHHLGQVRFDEKWELPLTLSLTVTPDTFPNIHDIGYITVIPQLLTPLGRPLQLPHQPGLPQMPLKVTVGLWEPLVLPGDDYRNVSPEQLTALVRKQRKDAPTGPATLTLQLRSLKDLWESNQKEPRHLFRLTSND